MSDEATTIESVITGRTAYNIVQEDGKTYIVNAVTDRAEYVIDGTIAGGGVEVMTTAERTAITPEAGQLIYDSDEDKLYLGDGITPGGNAVSSGSGGGDYTAGDGIRIIAGSTIARGLYGNIETVDVSGASPSVTMVPGHGYSIDATSSKGILLNVEDFASDKFGLDDAHLEIYTANTGYVQTGLNVELAERLEPDSINYCTVRFRRSMAIISVEDHIGGFIVVDGGTAGSGTLNYGIASAGSQYISFNDTLAGRVINMNGAIANGAKAIVGNSYADTTLTGAINCGMSKFTVANLALQDVVVNGGVMTLGDAYIPSGSTVSVSGGGLAVEKVTGSGVIDFNGGGLHIVNPFVVSGVTLTDANAGTTSQGLNNAFQANSSGVFAACVISGNHTSMGVVRIATADVVLISNCEIVDNTVTVGSPGGGIVVNGTATVTIEGCTIKNNRRTTTDQELDICTYGTTILRGSNAFGYLYGNGSCVVSSGAIIDLTGNTNATPIVPGGGVIVDGGCQVITSAGSTVSIAGGTYAKINNDGTAE